MLRHTTRFAGIALLTGVAVGGFALPTGDEIRTQAISQGITFDDALPAPRGGLAADLGCFGGGTADRVELPRPIDDTNPFARDTAYVSRDLGTFWMTHEDTRVVAAVRAWVGPFPLYGVAGRAGLAHRIRDDLQRRDLAYFVDGVPNPADGPSGETRPDLDSGGVLVALDAPPPGGADFFTEVAWIDPPSGLYWSHLTGGFPGADLWLGPFPAPLVVDAAPTAVRPRAVRARRRATRRSITIRRDVSGPADVHVRRRDYGVDDIELGQGVRVVRVLRATDRRLRVRIRIAPDAAPGARTVTVRGNATPDIFRIY